MVSIPNYSGYVEQITYGESMLNPRVFQWWTPWVSHPDPGSQPVVEAHGTHWSQAFAGGQRAARWGFRALDDDDWGYLHFRKPRITSD